MATLQVRNTKRPKLRRLFWLFLGILLSSACGPVMLTAKLLEAESRLEEAQRANARWHAPFEYYYADAHLTQARQEAARASYEDAIRYAKTARDYAQKATALTRQRREESP